MLVLLSTEDSIIMLRTRKRLHFISKSGGPPIQREYNKNVSFLLLSKLLLLSTEDSIKCYISHNLFMYHVYFNKRDCVMVDEALGVSSRTHLFIFLQKENVPVIGSLDFF